MLRLPLAIFRQKTVIVFVVVLNIWIMILGLLFLPGHVLFYRRRFFSGLGGAGVILKIHIKLILVA